VTRVRVVTGGALGATRRSPPQSAQRSGGAGSPSSPSSSYRSRSRSSGPADGGRPGAAPSPCRRRRRGFVARSWRSSRSGGCTPATRRWSTAPTSSSPSGTASARPAPMPACVTPSRRADRHRDRHRHEVLHARRTVVGSEDALGRDQARRLDRGNARGGSPRESLLREV